jgi:hypothetical protein
VPAGHHPQHVIRGRAVAAALAAVVAGGTLTMAPSPAAAAGSSRGAQPVRGGHPTHGGTRPTHGGTRPTHGGTRPIRGGVHLAGAGSSTVPATPSAMLRAGYGIVTNRNDKWLVPPDEGRLIAEQRPGFAFSEPPYRYFTAKWTPTGIALYEDGKAAPAPVATIDRYYRPFMFASKSRYAHQPVAGAAVLRNLAEDGYHRTTLDAVESAVGQAPFGRPHRIAGLRFDASLRIAREELVALNTPLGVVYRRASGDGGAVPHRLVQWDLSHLHAGGEPAALVTARGKARWVWARAGFRQGSLEQVRTHLQHHGGGQSTTLTGILYVTWPGREPWRLRTDGPLFTAGLDPAGRLRVTADGQEVKPEWLRRNVDDLHYLPISKRKLISAKLRSFFHRG